MEGADRQTPGIVEGFLWWRPVTVYEAARRVDRDVKAAHTDFRALLSSRVLSRTEAGQLEFSHEAIKVEFPLQAA